MSVPFRIQASLIVQDYQNAIACDTKHCLIATAVTRALQPYSSEAEVFSVIGGYVTLIIKDKKGNYIQKRLYELSKDVKQAAACFDLQDAAFPQLVFPFNLEKPRIIDLTKSVDVKSYKRKPPSLAASSLGGQRAAQQRKAGAALRKVLRKKYGQNGDRYIGI